jgi:PAB1-binding protein PBP1
MNLMGKVSDDRARSASAKGELARADLDSSSHIGFQTDTAISGQSAQSQRELLPWSPDGGANGAAVSTNGRNGHSKDAETFGFDGPPSDTPWDQFETNAKLFGVTTDYKEELYTTKLDRSGTNYKQREKDATRLANEIMGVSSARS